jgi:hypothetical protein
LNADAEVAYTDEEIGVADDVRDGGCNTRVDLCRAEDGWVLLVVEGYEEDVRYEWRGRRASR